MTAIRNAISLSYAMLTANIHDTELIGKVSLALFIRFRIPNLKLKISM